MMCYQKINSSNSIRLRGVVMEDFVNYYLPSMFLISSFCD